MSSPVQNTSPPHALVHDVLRRLALKANGLTGADIERLVREARQKARREQRTLEWCDLETILTVAKPDKPESLRWRMALHESGHAVARLVLKLGRVTMITIDGRDGGGMVEGDQPAVDEETEERAEALLLIRLAGRAAEQELLGSVTAGSGGTSSSDLAGATELAVAMETSLGFARNAPLLYRATDDKASLLIYSPEIASRVNARLEAAYAKACELIRRYRKAIETLARALMDHDTLEGRELGSIFQQLEETLTVLPNP
ncbi:ATP-dependent Zn protease [Mesorhizobium sp. M0276]|uniref:ATP-dependent Zn protease n=1 Tax=Mesorhizobium sp. M0276 TaxID=2956928 RepID=UPI00333C9543